MAILRKNYRTVGGANDVLDRATSTTTGTEVDVSQFQHIGVTIIGENDDGANPANATIKCQGSHEPTSGVNFASAAAYANPWDYAAMYNLNDPSSIITGDTGVSFAGANSVEQYIINTSALQSVNFTITAYTAGKITVKVYPVNNQ